MSSLRRWNGSRFCFRQRRRLRFWTGGATVEFCDHFLRCDLSPLLFDHFGDLVIFDGIHAGEDCGIALVMRKFEVDVRRYLEEHLLRVERTHEDEDPRFADADEQFSLYFEARRSVACADFDAWPLLFFEERDHALKALFKVVHVAMLAACGQYIESDLNTQIPIFCKT